MVKEIGRKVSDLIGGRLTIPAFFVGLVPRPPRMVSEVLSIVLIPLDLLTRPWRQLLWLGLYWYISAWSTVLVWGVRLVCAPFQLLNAPYRERHAAAQLIQLQVQCHELQRQNREWETKYNWAQDEHERARQAMEHALRCERKKVLAFERKHKKAQEEHGRIKRSMDEALVCERKKTAERVEILKLRVATLEAQNRRFSKVSKPECIADYHQLPSKDIGSGRQDKELLSTLLLEGPLKGERNAANDDTIFSKYVADGTEIDVVVGNDKAAGIALSSSLFSATLCTLVGGIAWGPQDPCIPLVTALLVVVGMSMVNVVRLLKILNRPDFDAIALLSFNWFILGTVSSPAFPHIANFMSRILEQFVPKREISAGTGLTANL